MIKALVLVGPTGVGKTSVSIKIAKDFFPDKFEIISADSVQVYKYLNIGTGKINKEEQKGVPHYLIDKCDPHEHFTANDFCVHAQKICSSIFTKGKIPFFVGGTGLYINAFFEGLSKVPEIDPVIRKELIVEISKRGLDSLYAELKAIDPPCAAKIHKNDKQRIIRGLEVFRGTGKLISYYWGQKKGCESAETLYIGLIEDSETLYEKINLRVDQMIEKGFVQEVEKLIEDGYSLDDKALNSIGYAELFRYFKNEISFEDAVKMIKKESRRYAKRQLTWFKRNKKVNWFKNTELDQINEVVKNWISI